MNSRDKEGAKIFGVCLPEGTHSVDVTQTLLDYVTQNLDDEKYNPSFLIYS